MTAAATPAEQAEALAPKQSQALLEERYGAGARKRSDKRLGWIAAGLLLLGGLVFLLFSGWQQGSQIAWQDISANRLSKTAMQVRFEVSTNPTTPVACAVKALDKSKGVVGWKVITLPTPHRGTYTVTTKIRTAGNPVAGTVHSCWSQEK